LDARLLPVPILQEHRLNISQNVAKFVGSGPRQPTGREASFDFCYNYFQAFRKRNAIEAIVASENVELSCLQLGFYLASWGMLRGSSPLLGFSSKHYQQLLENLVRFDPAIWAIDVPDYADPAKVSLLIECGKMIEKDLKHDSHILRTKVMLGVFGNVPAFDGNFCLPGFGVGKNATFCEQTLGNILRFYSANQMEIDSHKIPTLDFPTGKPTSLLYPRAKIIDMVGYVEGGGPQ
jgi:hypothetical protein